MAVRSVVGESEGYGRSRFSMLAANPFADHGEFYPIATVTVGSGGAANIEFTSIPGTYQHLQIRMVARSTGTKSDGIYSGLRFNSDTGTAYAFHRLSGEGSAASAGAISSDTSAYIQRFSSASHSASIFGASIVDILDYTSTSKNKTVRNLGGYDANGSGSIYVVSDLWYATPAAITTITLTPETGNFAQHTTAALYGIKAP